MRTASEKILKRGCNENGEQYTVKIEIPCFSDEEEAGKRLNDFYRRLSDRIEQTAEKCGCTVIGELHIAFSGEDILSLYIDLLWYRERDLLACRRISDTRTANGLEVLLPQKLKKRVPRNGGWYYNGLECVIYENKFTPGAEQGVRRSQYYKFFAETKFPMKINNFVALRISDGGVLKH